MREATMVCDECHDTDPTTRPATIEYDNGFSEELDLCSFCRGEIEGAHLRAALPLAA